MYKRSGDAQTGHLAGEAGMVTDEAFRNPTRKIFEWAIKAGILKTFLHSFAMKGGGVT